MLERNWPDFIAGKLPRAEVPVPGLDARIVDDGRCQVALFAFADAGTVPEHTHADKWGIVVDGSMELTVAGSTEVIRAGGSYFVPAGTAHGARVEGGTRIIEIFAEQRFELD